jgi:predicted dienelactone hydrolase
MTIPLPQRLVAAAVAFGSAWWIPGLTATPAAAVEQLDLRLPVMDMTIQLQIGESRTAADLIRANADLQELDRAGDGAVQRLLEQLLTAPLPEQITGVVQQSLGQPLFEQALLAASELVEVEGLPPEGRGPVIAAALDAAYRAGEPHLLGLLRQVPRERITLNLQALAAYAQRLQNNQDEARRLLRQATAATPASASIGTLDPSVWRRQELTLLVPHRPEPLTLITYQPQRSANGRLVVISHGLWDDPANFEGWARLLVMNGYTVVLPRHPGSDSAQQQAMLMGDQPPPGPEEMRWRPLDVSAVLDGLAAGRLLPGSGVTPSQVAVVGHSWGATAALQLGGLNTTSSKLKARCNDPADPERNLSWVLQCSWLEGSDQESLADPRVQAVVAVSPPLKLLFDQSRVGEAQARTLIISGTSDWVVPPDPEAVSPLRQAGIGPLGHRLVLVEGGDHFNLRAPAAAASPAILGPLILAWVNQQLAVPAAITFQGGGWGNAEHALVDVTPSLSSPR